MFAIAFDLKVEDAARHHPVSVRAAYADVAAVLGEFGFARVQGSVFVCEREDMALLLAAMNALKALPWFAKAARDIRAFRVELWSDFTAFVKN